MEPDEYIFPFSTCEKVNKNGIAQPYSTVINIINSIIILYFLLQTNHLHNFLLLFSILCFETFHVFSHIVHIPGMIQTNMIHILAYFINIAFLFFFYNHVKKIPAHWFILLYSFLLLFDIYAFFNMGVIYYFATQTTLFLCVLFYYYAYMGKTIKKNIQTISLLALTIVILVVNEKYNCDKMLALNSDFPYHIVIEIIGIFLFYTICSSFYNL